ncbi:O-antigen ligase family protein [Flavobacterium okayamense]|uniref:Ligase n=1 Tax=Flavobacterium okayamense TaxID=2830782 RepID=A0ABM7S1Y0_9FLAO|nr:O-antigen ligase family protein [Flavobacterium okayamense]BCY27231.1 ligase [Flavobacterium okayamense]
METNSGNKYLKLIFLHIILGVICFLLPVLTKLYSLIVFGGGLWYVIKNKNRNLEVLQVAAYITGIEVFFRMTNGMHITEYAKYSIIIFMILGMFYDGIKKSSYIYVLFLLLLLPGIFVGINNLRFDTNIRKAIAFNISGPVCLGISAIYCFGKDIKFEVLKKVLLYMTLPIATVTTYIFLFTPSVKDVVTNTQSNFEASGGYGPNQVSTVLGLGMFLFFFQILLNSKSRSIRLFNAILLGIVSFRAIVTFSRGGVMTGLAMIVFLLIFTFLLLNFKAKARLIYYAIIGIIFSLGIWTYSSLETQGMIDKRYANQSARGIEKESQLSGRETLMSTEMQMFLDNPFFGVGVGKNKEYREELTGIEAASHNEITRMVAEHGLFGVLAFIILLFTPILRFLANRRNIFIISFLAFWGLTINHAAMRLAAPAFIYALSLLNVIFVEENESIVHRE